jgi:predicted double-glycine peptidase
MVTIGPLVTCVLVIILGFWGGLRLSRCGPRTSNIAGLLCVAVIAAWIVTQWCTDLSYRLIPWHEYVFYQRAWLVLAICVLIAICYRQSRRLVRLVLGTLVCCFIAYSVFDMGAPVLLRSCVERLDDDRQGAGPVSQTSGWSCGAAATATLLRLNGVPASERQVAELAGTSPIEGTDIRGAARAVEILGGAQGLVPHLRIGLPARDIAILRTPCTFEYKLYPTLWHVAVMMSIDGDIVDVEDPLLGRDKWTKEQLAEKWVGTTMEIERR